MLRYIQTVYKGQDIRKPRSSLGLYWIKNASIRQKIINAGKHLFAGKSSKDYIQVGEYHQYFHPTRKSFGSGWYVSPIAIKNKKTGKLYLVNIGDRTGAYGIKAKTIKGYQFIYP